MPEKQTRPGRPRIPESERRVRLGLLVSPEARYALQALAEERGVAQNRVVEDLIFKAIKSPPA